MDYKIEEDFGYHTLAVTMLGKNGQYVRCGHPEAMNCNCYGRKHEGGQTPENTDLR